MKLPLVAAAAASALALSGIAAAAPVSAVVHISASANGLKYTQSQLTAKAGRIEVVFRNPSRLQHNVRFESGETELGGTKTIVHGTTSTFVTLKPGRYHFYCSVPGHEDAGMQGYLTVR